MAGVFGEYNSPLIRCGSSYPRPANSRYPSRLVVGCHGPANSPCWDLRHTQHRMFTMRCVFALFAFLVASHVAAQGYDPDGGLKTECATVGLFVAELSVDAKQIGLTKDRIQTTVESRLRGSRIYGLDESNPTELFVNINVFSQAVSIDMRFRRFLINDLDVRNMFQLIEYSLMYNLEGEALRLLEKGMLSGSDDEYIEKLGALLAELGKIGKIDDSQITSDRISQIFLEQTLGWATRKRIIGTVWEAGKLGLHGDDPEFVLQLTAELVDRFINEYLGENEEYCD